MCFRNLMSGIERKKEGPLWGFLFHFEFKKGDAIKLSNMFSSYFEDKKFCCKGNIYLPAVS